MKGNLILKINKKTALFLSLTLGLYAFADYVSIIDTKSSGGITVEETVYIDSTPVGSVMLWGTRTPPNGWIELNGQSTSSYPELAKVYGSNVPDLRGEFVRGFDNGRGIDANRSIATYQPGTKITGEVGIPSSMNTHTINNINNVYGDPIYETNFDMTIQWDAETANQNSSVSSSYWATVRPRNISMMYIVKAVKTDLNNLK
jgi:hypothetical protein